MGIFYQKMIESAAIQDPEDIGIDLDAIEDNVMGDDGIEAHRDEVDAAVDGMIGDPMDEASVIVYESEYNFNQIMKAIGIAELNEAYAGRDFFLEGENKEGFFSRVRSVIARVWESITKVFKDCISWIQERTNHNKNWANKNRDKIIEGFKSRNWTVETYDMGALCRTQDYVKLMDKAIATESPLFASAKDAITRVKSSNADKSEGEFNIADAIKNVVGNTLFGREVDSLKSLKSNLIDVCLIPKTYDGRTGDGIYSSMDKDVLDTLTGNEIGELKKKHNELKKVYNKYVAELGKIEREAEKPNDRSAANYGAVTGTMIKYANAIRTELNVYNTIFSAMLKCYKVKRANAYKMATRWLAATGKAANKVKIDKNIEYQAESAFMNIDII